MSPTQFTDAITNLNASGVPVTITRRDGKTMEHYPLKNTFKEFEDEFNDDVIKHFQDLGESDAEWKKVLNDAKDVMKNNLRQDKVYTYSYDDAREGEKVSDETGIVHNETPIKYSDVQEVKKIMQEKGIEGAFISSPDSGGIDNSTFNSIMNIFYKISPNY